jgi:ribosomal protein L40E
MARDFLTKVSKSNKQFDKVCTNCGWEGKTNLQTRKCKECGSMNLKIKE